MKRFCSGEFWLPMLGFMLTALVTAVAIAVFVFTIKERQYKNFYVNHSEIGTYRVYQYVRYGLDVAVFTATNPEAALEVYRQLTTQADCSVQRSK